MKKYLLLFSLLFFASSAFAANIEGELVCPDAKQEGTKLVCSVQLANYGCSDVKITRSMVMFIGNSGNTLGGTGIWGPYVRGFLTDKIIPAGDQDECISNGGFFATTPGTFASNIKIIDPVPPSIAPTAGVAILRIEFTNLVPEEDPSFPYIDLDESISVNAMVEILP